MIAIAITLLVLELGVPKPEAPGTLAHKLAEQWPSYAAYVVSFLTIGVIWINHHAMLRRVQTVDHPVLVFNLVLLLLIGVLPWSTALLAEYLREDQGQHLAAGIYAGSLLAACSRMSWRPRRRRCRPTSCWGSAPRSACTTRCRR